MLKSVLIVIVIKASGAIDPSYNVHFKFKQQLKEMSRKISTLIVNGDNTGLQRVGDTDPKQRDRQLLIKAIQIELNDHQKSYNLSEFQFRKIEKMLSCVVRYLEKENLLARFAQSIELRSYEVKLIAKDLDRPIDKEEKEPQVREERRSLLLKQMHAFLQTQMQENVQSPNSTPKSLPDVPEQDSVNFGGQPHLERSKRKTTLEFSFSKKTDPELAIFTVNGEVIQYVHRSLFLFDSECGIRKKLVQMVESRLFNDFIMIVIVLNSISIAYYDHSLRHKTRNVILKYLSYVFASIYLFEAAAKIIASGFILGKNTYLRKPTNVLDFIIVLSSLAEIIFTIFAGELKKAITVFRILKVFRMLKLLSAFFKIPQMRQQIRTLERAFTGILNALIFLGTFFVFFAIIGLQLFSDDIFNACRLSKEPIEIEGKKVWQRAPIDGLSPGGICSKSTNRYTFGGFKCPPQYTCGSVLDYGMRLEDDEVQFNSQLFYNVAIWKHFGSSLLAIFQIVTTDTWGDHMYNLISASNFVAPVIFCFCIHMVGTYYIMNLMIIVIMESYIESNEIYAQDDIAQQETSIRSFEQTLPYIYNQKKTAIQDFISSHNFDETIQEYEPPKETEKTTETVQQSTSPDKRTKSGETAQISMHEPEIEDRLAIRVKALSDVDEDSDFQSSMSEGESNSVSSIILLPDYIMIKLKELYEFLVKIENEQNRQSFITFMQKAAAVASFQSVEHKINAQQLISMELELLNLKFEKELREKYNEERFVRYGLKQEKKVLSIISQSVQGMFDYFASRHVNMKEKIRLLNSSRNLETSMIEQDSVINLQHQSSASPLAGLKTGIKSPGKSITSHKSSIMKHELYAIRKKARLELRDELILTLNHMNIVQNDIKVSIENQENFSEKAAHDLMILSQVIDELHFKEYDQIVQIRVLQSSLYQLCLKIEKHWLFQTLITLSILANFVVLTIETYPSDPTREIRQETSNIFFFFIFMMEMVIKMIGNGPVIYFKNSFNVFDFIVIFISTIDLILNNINMGGTISLQAIRAIRVFRLLRMFKLAKSWKSFNETLNLLFETFKKVSYLICLLILFWMTYAILGKELFAFKMSFVDNDYPVVDDFDFTLQKQLQGSAPDFNFNTFLSSVNSVFIFFSDDGWNAIFHDAFRMPGINKVLTILFFSTLYIGGNMVGYQLFRAILLREFDQKSILQQVEKDRIREKKSNKSLAQRVSANILAVYSQNNQINNLPQTQFGQEGRTYSEWFRFIPIAAPQKPQSGKDRSLFIFGPDNKIRLFVKKIEKYEVKRIIILNAVIYLAIGISSLLPALSGPTTDSESKFAKTLYWIDAAMTILFTLEVIIKIISKGLVFNGPSSYLRRKYSNILDFLVVVVSLSSQFLSNVDLSFVKVIRIITRLARPLRLVFRDERLKISIKVLIAVMPEILRLIAINFLFCLIFATISVNLLAGRMYYCDGDHLSFADKQFIQQNVVNAEDCFNLGGVWEKSYRNYDNIWNAFIQMFTMTQAVGWRFNLLDVMQSTGVNQEPRITPPYKSGGIFSLFIVVWMIVGYFFIKNLFVGVVIAGYNRESEKNGASISLTDAQRKLQETELLTFRLKPLYRHQKPQNRFRACLYNMIHNSDDSSKKKIVKDSKKKEKQPHKQTDLGFEIFIICVMVLNASVLVLKWPNMSPFVQLTVDIIGYTCTGIYFFEATIKLIAYGKAYFRMGWNVFDFLIVVGSLIFISPRFRKQRLVITFIKTIKILKVIMMLEKFKKIQTFYQTITKTLMSMFNVGLLMFLIIYIFAIIGVQLFATIKLNGPMTELYNFQTVPKACLTLYRVMTRDHWNLLLEALSISNTDDQPCIKNPKYADYIANGKQMIGCGKPLPAVLYLFIFSLLVSVIFLSLFIAIIMSAYTLLNSSNKDHQVAEMINEFQVEWSNFDPQATGMLLDKDFEGIMFKLGEPLGWHQRHRFDKKLLAHFKIKIAEKMPKHRADPLGRWYFEEVLDQLLFYYLVRQDIKLEMEKAKIKFEQNAIMKRTRLPSPRNLDLLRIQSALPQDNSELTPPREESLRQNSPAKSIRSGRTIRSAQRSVRTIRSAQSQRSQRTNRSQLSQLAE